MEPGEDTPQASDFSPEQAPTLRDLLMVSFILALFHFGLFHIAAWNSVTSSAAQEFSRVEAALFDQMPPKENFADFAERTKAKWSEQLLSLPFVSVYKVMTKKTAFYSSFEVPYSVRLLNSAFCGVLLHVILFLLSQFLSEQNALRKFLEGRGIWARGGLPKFLDHVPIFRAAREMERLERTRYGRVLVIAVFHAILTGAANVVSVGVNLGSNYGGGTSSLTIFSRILRFPLTPLLVDERFWQTSQKVELLKTIVILGNSLLVAFLIGVVWSIFGYRKRLGTLEE